MPFFPFSQKPQNLDFNAFQRAVGFRAAEGNLDLGDNADGIAMNADRYPDDSARASKDLWMIFGSLAGHFAEVSGLEVVETSLAGLSNTEDDLLEVLALTQPHKACIIPAPIEELRNPNLLRHHAPILQSLAKTF